MKHLRVATLVLAACAAGCVVPPDTRAADDRRRVMSPLAQLPATYTGRVAGQAWQLDLLEMGRWQLRRDGSDALGGFALEDDRLILQSPAVPDLVLRLRPDGRLSAPGGALLARQTPARPFEPRLVLSGWFTYFADAPRIVLCADGRALPVQQAGDYLALERAYTAAAPAPGAPLWARLEATIAPRPAMELGQPPVSTLVVQRFERVDPQGRCEGLKADRPFIGTEWRLVWLQGVAAAPARATLRFDGGRVAGSDGCNRLMGPARIDGDRLAIGPLAGTRMACAQGQAEADAFSAALARVQGHRVQGEMLSLTDAGGSALLRLRAVD